MSAFCIDLKYACSAYIISFTFYFFTFFFLIILLLKIQLILRILRAFHIPCCVN